MADTTMTPRASTPPKLIPKMALRRARSSGVASSGNIRSVGLPVMRPKAKTMIATQNSKTTPCSRRRMM